MRTNTYSCGILTFAILLLPSLVLYQGKHLGENHQKLVIPAGNVKGWKIEGPQAGHPIPKARS